MNLRQKNLFLLMIIFSLKTAYAQFESAFEVNNPNIKVVRFQADQVSEIHLKTHLTSIYKFSSSAESTYKTELYFDYHIQNDSLIIKSIYPKSLEFGDNKMTSMQEFSVSVNFTLPQDSRLIIESDMASVVGQGQFAYFQLDTKSGHCSLKTFTGNGNINTYSGNIKIHTKNADIEAFTQNGNLRIDRFYAKQYQINLKSVNGDIMVRQME